MSQDQIFDITVQQFKQLWDSGEEFLLLDCRTPEEFQIARLDCAQLIPMSDLEQRASELEAYRDQRIVVQCHLGGRSQMVAQWLRVRGFGVVQNMLGGIDAWAEQIDPSMTRY